MPQLIIYEVILLVDTYFQLQEIENLFNWDCEGKIKEKICIIMNGMLKQVDMF